MAPTRPEQPCFMLGAPRAGKRADTATRVRFADFEVNPMVEWRAGVRRRCSSGPGRAAFGAVIQAQLLEFPSQGVPVDAQSLGGLRLVATVFLQNAPDERSLELGHGVCEEDTLLDHLADEGFKLALQGQLRLA